MKDVRHERPQILWNVQDRQNINTENLTVVSRRQGEGRMESANGYIFSFLGNENVLKLGNGDGCTYKNHWIVP